MNYTRKLASLLLALVMVVAMAVNVWADETTKPGSVTIDNAVNGKTYTIYRIFDIDSHNADYSAFNYKVNSAWSGFFATGAAGLKYVDIDETYGYVTWKGSADAAAFAADAIKYATDNSITGSVSDAASGSSVTFSNLDLGYYLVKSSLGSLCSLDMTTPNATIKEKNGEPTIEKQVQEDYNNEWGKKNDADLGQTVNYKTTINVIDGQPVKYVLHDKMTGLTFTGVTSITVQRNGKNIPLTSGTDYTVKTTEVTDGCSFEVHFTDTSAEGVTASVLKPNDVVTVNYSATVNTDAVIAGTGNPNETWLKYGENGETQHHETRTYVWEVKVFKYTVKGENSEAPLAGAEFKLYKQENNQNKYATATEIKDKNEMVTGYKITGWTETEASGTTFVSPETGKFDIVGLDADSYKLVETKAPAGYNKLDGEISIVITKEYSGVDNNTGTATVTYGGSSTGEVKVLNQTGTQLPSTGGVGTTIFYVLGSVLVLAAVVLLVTKKRMGTEG